LSLSCSSSDTASGVGAEDGNGAMVLDAVAVVELATKDMRFSFFVLIVGLILLLMLGFTFCLSFLLLKFFLNLDASPPFFLVGGDTKGGMPTSTEFIFVNDAGLIGNVNSSVELSDRVLLVTVPGVPTNVLLPRLLFLLDRVFLCFVICCGVVVNTAAAAAAAAAVMAV
jgi:hypothetical protein